MKKILYLGKTDSYIQSFEKKLKSYNQIFLLRSFGYNASLQNALLTATAFLPDLIIFEPTGNVMKDRSIMRDLSNIGGVKKIPIFSFLTNDQPLINFRKTTTLGGIYYFQKNQNLEEIVYMTMVFLNPSLQINPKLVRANLNYQSLLSQFIWINYMSKSYAKIESQRDWGDEGLVRFELPYPQNLFKMPKYRLNSKSSGDLQNHFKYSYKLEYQYNFATLKTHEKAKLLSDLRYQLQDELINESTYLEIEKIDKKPKSLLLVSDKAPSKQDGSETNSAGQIIKNLEGCARALFFNWLLKNTKDTSYHKDVVTIYDQKYFSLWTGLKALEQKNVDIIRRAKIVNAFEEMLKDRPSVIVVCFDEENNFEKMAQLLRATTQHRDYFPFLLVFNYDELDVETLRHNLQYHFVIATKADFSESLVVKLLEINRNKKTEKESKKASKNYEVLNALNINIPEYNEKIFFDYKVFHSLENKESLLPISINIELISLGEYEVYFRTDEKLEEGEIFYINKPLKMNLLIVPHIKASKESAINNCYRGIIHGVELSDRSELKKFIKDIEKATLAKGSDLTVTESTNILNEFNFT